MKPFPAWLAMSLTGSPYKIAAMIGAGSMFGLREGEGVGMFFVIGGNRVIKETIDPVDALQWLKAASVEYEACIAEVIIPSADPRTAIPGELDRAITEWNERIVGKLKFAKPMIRARSHFVDPFRKWKKNLGKRDYFLWQLIDDILAANEFTQAWMRFGLLFVKKDGEYHSDLLRAGHYRDPKRRLPDPPETTAQRAARTESDRAFAQQLREQKAKNGGLRDIDSDHLARLESEGY